MARSENQGIQVWLILTVILLVAVGVFAFIFYKQAGDATKEMESAKKAKADSDKAISKIEFQNQYLKHMIGWAQKSKDELQVIKNSLGEVDSDWQKMDADYKKDMATVKSAGVPEEQLNYRNFFQLVLTQLSKRHHDVSDLNQKSNQAIAAREAALKEKEDEVNRQAAALDKAVRDLADVRQKLQNQLADVRALADREADKRRTSETNSQKKIQQMTVKITDITKQLADSRTAIQNLVERTKQREEDSSFKIADGKIVWVNQRSNMVWINLGRADGLRRATTFSVYDRDESGVAKPVRKGAIEVLRIVNDHSAEARITESNSSNPILMQDKIYTPVWRPGRKVHFGIAGLVDVTGNGKTDRSMVRSLIRQSGGVIDYEIDAAGKVLTPGKAMTVNTRFLVVGTAPADIPGSTAEANSKYSDTIKKAQQLGIERISIDKLLSYMGWTGNAQITPLGKRAGTNYKIKPTGQSRVSTGSNAFRKDAPRRTALPRK